MQKFCEILSEVKTIAVVGISRDEYKTSRRIAAFLQSKNYKVVGVNPAASNIEGMEVYPSLTDIPYSIDLINVFRRSEDIPELIPAIVEVKPKYLWLQLGIRNDEAILPAKESGIICIQDYCIKIEYFNCSGKL